MSVEKQEPTFEETIESVGRANMTCLRIIQELENAKLIFLTILEDQKGVVALALKPVYGAMLNAISDLHTICSVQSEAFTRFEPSMRENRLKKRAHDAEQENLRIRQELELMNGRVLFVTQGHRHGCGGVWINGIELLHYGPESVEADGDVFKFKPRQEPSEE